MKKSFNELAAVSLCVVLSLSAFTLPAITKAYAASSQGLVENHNTPGEYMENFSAEEGTKYVDYNKLVAVVPTSQLEEMKAIAIAEFKKTFGLEVPQGFKFEHSTINSQLSENSKEVRTTLTWSDGTYGTDEFSENTQFFSATFISDTNIDTAFHLYSLNIKNGIAYKNIENFLEEGKEYLIAELYAEEDFEQLEISTLIIAYYEYENDSLNAQNINLQLEWSKYLSDMSASSYNVSFDHVDMKNHTGEVTGAINFFTIDKQQDIAFTENQEAELLAAAQEFLAENNIPSPSLVNRPYAGNAAYRLNQTMWFIFEYKTEEADGNIKHADVYIDSNQRILGYRF